MFTAGRILRKKSVWTVASDDLHAGSEVDYSRQRRKFRCYIPCVRQSILATVAGFVVMATGGCFCIVGFYAAHQQNEQSQSPPNELAAQPANDNNYTEVVMLMMMYDDNGG